MNNPTDLVWYALRITYSRELALKEYLDSEQIENFVPMQYKYIVKDERKIRKLVPVVHNLIFIRSFRKRIDEVKSTVGVRFPLRYIMDRETNQPVIVPDKQMQNFIAVAGTYDQQVVYLGPATGPLKKGDHVRITGGIFEGVEGELIRVKGDRRVMVSIQGVMAIATAFIHPSLVELVLSE